MNITSYTVSLTRRFGNTDGTDVTPWSDSLPDKWFRFEDYHFDGHEFTFWKDRPYFSYTFFWYPKTLDTAVSLIDEIHDLCLENDPLMSFCEIKLSFQDHVNKAKLFQMDNA